MNIVTKVINTIFLLLVFSSSLAAEVTASDELQYDSDKQASIAMPTDPYLMWEQYRLDEGLEEGKNVRGERFFLIAYAEAIVGMDKNDSDFMISRYVAYGSALAAAKKQMAAYLNTEIESGTALILSQFSNDVTNRLRKEVGEPLSIMDKAATLTGLSLDNEIKKFDPNWDGTKKTDADRIVKMAAESERYTMNLTNKSYMFLQGVTPIFNAEGSNFNNDYVVAVGIVWSGKSARVAESVYNPTVAPPQGKKSALTIKDRLDNLSDEELAATLGVRIWWDEEGLPVVVSFAQAKGTGSTLIARDKTEGLARGQIALFVAEQITSSGFDKIDQEIHFYDDGSHTPFNLSAYQQKILAKANVINIKGAGTVLYKKIVHPITEKRIVVNVVTWSPESNLIARALGKMSDDQATTMDATKAGTVFENYQESTDENSVGTVSTTGLQGVSSDSDDF